MDLLALAVDGDKPRTLTLLHPEARTPLPVTIDLFGKDSGVFVACEQASRNRAVENARKGAKFSAAEVDQEAVEALAKCTAGWSGIPIGWINGSADATPAPFSTVNAVALYSNRSLRWVREQVDEFVAERANFLPASPPPSAPTPPPSSALAE